MQQVLNFLIENWIPLSTTIGAIWLYFDERKKRQTEGRMGINDATEGMQNMYDKFVADANDQYDKLNQKIMKLQDNESKAVSERNEISLELSKLKSDVAKDKQRIFELETKVIEYEAEIQKYKEQVKNLKAELNRYKNSR